MTETYDRAPEAPNRLYRAAAWVGIVAGVVFIVTTVFFAGLVAGRVSDRDAGWHRGPGVGQMGPAGMAGCPMMQSGGMNPPMAPRP